MNTRFTKMNNTALSQLYEFHMNLDLPGTNPIPGTVIKNGKCGTTSSMNTFCPVTNKWIKPEASFSCHCDPERCEDAWLGYYNWMTGLKLKWMEDELGDALFSCTTGATQTWFLVFFFFLCYCLAAIWEIVPSCIEMIYIWNCINCYPICTE